MLERLLLPGRSSALPLLWQDFKSAAMLWTDQLEVATIKCENARDVQTLRYRDDQRVYEIELGIGIFLFHGGDTASIPVRDAKLTLTCDTYNARRFAVGPSRPSGRSRSTTFE